MAESGAKTFLGIVGIVVLGSSTIGTIAGAIHASSTGSSIALILMSVVFAVATYAMYDWTARG